MNKVGTRSKYSCRPFDDIQGLVASGYSDRPHMTCLLFTLERRVEAISSLRRLRTSITSCDFAAKYAATKLNIALTYSGMVALAPEVVVNCGAVLHREFCEGMVTPHRRRVLGDLDHSPSAPEQWKWGGPDQEEIHVVVLVYDVSVEARQRSVAAVVTELQGMRLVRDGQIDSTPLHGNREHFGFLDGIAQPWMRGLTSEGAVADEVSWGEFLLGYCDNTGAAEKCPEFAVNGSYLVIRQLKQDVQGFRQSLTGADQERIELAAKFVGRWPDGTPVTSHPKGPASNPTNNFGYRRDDADGLRCPASAHIRRCNPRDTSLSDAKASLARANRHRLLRRGRSYGSPAPANWYPAGVLESPEKWNGDGQDERGLLFMCLSANLERQFEFVQQTWVNDNMAGASSVEVDPIASHVAGGQFTIPFAPVRRRVPRGAPFIRVVGGVYAFLIGLRGLDRILAKAKDD